MKDSKDLAIYASAKISEACKDIIAMFMLSGLSEKEAFALLGYVLKVNYETFNETFREELL